MKNPIKFLFLLTAFMMLVAVSTASQIQVKENSTTTTATLSANDTALQACSTAISSNNVMTNAAHAFTATTPVNPILVNGEKMVKAKKEVAEERSDLTMYGMAKQSITEIIASTNLTAGTNQARVFNANTEASVMWVSDLSVLTNNTLTGTATAMTTVTSTTAIYALFCGIEEAAAQNYQTAT